MDLVRTGYPEYQDSLKHGFNALQVATDGQHLILDETTGLQPYKNDRGACGETGVDPSETDQHCVDLSVHPFELGRGMLFRLESRCDVSPDSSLHIAM